MTLAIRYGERDEEDSGFIYFDCITAFTESYTGQVSKHPISTGVSVVDAYIRNNPTFTLSGVITGVDVSTGTYLITDLDDFKPYNTPISPVSAVSVESTDQSVLTKFIPSSISQFLPESTPTVNMDDARENVLSQVRDLLINLTSGTKLNEETGQFDTNLQVVRLFEYTGSLLTRILNNLVITSITFREDANTGRALYCDINFEQATFAKLKKTVLPADVAAAVKKAASPKKSQGKVDSKTKDTGSADNTDPQQKKDDIDALRTSTQLNSEAGLN